MVFVTPTHLLPKTRWRGHPISRHRAWRAFEQKCLATTEDTTMILNHLNLTVTDVPAASAFLESYFGLQRTGGMQAWLS